MQVVRLTVRLMTVAILPPPSRLTGGRLDLDLYSCCTVRDALDDADSSPVARGNGPGMHRAVFIVTGLGGGAQAPIYLMPPRRPARNRERR